MNKLLFLLVLIVVPLVSASQILVIDMDICKNNSIILNEFNVTEGISTPYIEPGNYLVRISDFQNSTIFDRDIYINFMIMTDPPIVVDCSNIYLKIPYIGQMRRFEIYNGKLIFSKDLEGCNNEGFCEPGFESYADCPQDCVKALEPRQNPEVFPGQNYYLFAFVALLVIGLIVVAYRRRFFKAIF